MFDQNGWARNCRLRCASRTTRTDRGGHNKKFATAPSDHDAWEHKQTTSSSTELGRIYEGLHGKKTMMWSEILVLV